MSELIRICEMCGSRDGFVTDGREMMVYCINTDCQLGYRAKYRAGASSEDYWNELQALLAAGKAARRRKDAQ